MIRGIPTYNQGYARSAGQAEYPGLWRGLVGVWAPSLGPSGGTLYEPVHHIDGTLINMTLGENWQTERFGSILEYDGVDDSDAITLDDPENRMDVFRTGGSGVMTLYARVKRDEIGTHHSIIHKGTVTNTGWAWIIDATNMSEFSTLGVKAYNATTTIADTNFHTLAIVYDLSFDVSFYIDGKFSNKVTHTVAGNVATGDGGIGKQDGTIRRFDGLIGDIMMWERELSTQEIAHLDFDPSFHPLTLSKRIVANAPAVAAVHASSLVNSTRLKSKVGGVLT